MATFANAFQPAARLHLPVLRSLSVQISAFRARRRTRAQIIRELNSHTDRQLSDMGFSRGDIRAVADGTYRR